MGVLQIVACHMILVLFRKISYEGETCVCVVLQGVRVLSTVACPSVCCFSGCSVTVHSRLPKDSWFIKLQPRPYRPPFFSPSSPTPCTYTLHLLTLLLRCVRNETLSWSRQQGPTRVSAALPRITRNIYEVRDQR